jgi:hypothetical protein
MNGAREYYNLIKRALERGLGDLKYIDNCYLNENILYRISSHARGTCFHIYLVEDLQNISVNKSFEVYGVISGNLGWTESYGWIHNGNWNEPILNYLKNLESEIKLFDENIEKEKHQKEQERNLALNSKIDKFNAIFQKQSL